MATIEKTQFSMVELSMFLDEKRAPKNEREKSMFAFGDMPGAVEQTVDREILSCITCGAEGVQRRHRCADAARVAA